MLPKAEFLIMVGCVAAAAFFGAWLGNATVWGF